MGDLTVMKNTYIYFLVVETRSRHAATCQAGVLNHCFVTLWLGGKSVA